MNIIPFAATQLGSPLDIPDYIREAQEELGSNMESSKSLPQLRFKGKTWSVDLNGDQTVLTQADGETPVAIVKVVILATNPNRSRAYYEGAFDPEKSSAPTCYSTDGVRPDDGIKEPCARTCAACEFSKKGSKISENGKQTTACAAFKRIAVVPSNDLGFEPLFLRLPQTSVWDGDNQENEAKGWFAFDQYIKHTAQRGAQNTALLVTAVKFDPKEAYPKLLFKAEGWLPAEGVQAVKQILVDKAEEIKAIIGEAAKAQPAVAAPVPLAAPKKEVVAPKAAPVEEEEVIHEVPEVEKKAAPKKSAPKAVVVEEEEEAPTSGKKPAGLTSLLSSWDD